MSCFPSFIILLARELLDSFISRELERIQMETILIVLLVVFLLGGGGWGYSRYRRD
jgi:hypothetical protein